MEFSSSHPYSGASTQAQIHGAWFKILLSFVCLFVFLLLFAVCIVDV